MTVMKMEMEQGMGSEGGDWRALIRVIGRRLSDDIPGLHYL